MFEKNPARAELAEACGAHRCTTRVDQLDEDHYDLGKIKKRILEYMSVLPCPACGGARLRPESLAVRVAGRSISEVCQLSVTDALRVFTIRTLVAAKQNDLNREIITNITRGHKSKFLSTDFIF